MNGSNKVWLSPCIGLIFFAVSISGILMLFHLKLPGMYSLHKWGGLLFVVLGLFHLILNWRIFLAYFKKGQASVAVIAAAILLIMIAVMIPSKGHHQGQQSKRYLSKTGISQAY